MPRQHTWTDDANRALVRAVLEHGGLPQEGTFPGRKVSNASRQVIFDTLSHQGINTTVNGMQSQWSRLAKKTAAETGMLILQIQRLGGDGTDFEKAKRIANTPGTLEDERGDAAAHGNGHAVAPGLQPQGQSRQTIAPPPAQPTQNPRNGSAHTHGENNRVVDNVPMSVRTLPEPMRQPQPDSIPMGYDQFALPNHNVGGGGMMKHQPVDHNAYFGMANHYHQPLPYGNPHGAEQPGPTHHEQLLQQYPLAPLEQNHWSSYSYGSHTGQNTGEQQYAQPEQRLFGTNQGAAQEGYTGQHSFIDPQLEGFRLQHYGDHQAGGFWQEEEHGEGGNAM
ncbi:hypothetical protein GGR57DRAFT_498054 [Xylariaceae sp. FL1272]|nr:hypothetical protein GGR57DRAFT_498054 [Xylariaceae sp. FL1272]